MSLRPYRLLKRFFAVSAGLVITLVVLSDATPLSCQLANLTKPDFAAQAAEHVLETTAGVLDFRKLSDSYDQICIVDVDEPGQLSVPPELNLNLSHPIGRRFCGGWDSKVLGSRL